MRMRIEQTEARAEWCGVVCVYVGSVRVVEGQVDLEIAFVRVWPRTRRRFCN